MKPSLAIAALAVLALLAPASPGEAFAPGAKVCKDWISGTGSGPTQVHARQKARADWAAKATAAHGAAYGNLSLAVVGAFPCNHAQGKSFCTIRAKPCAQVPKQLPIKAK